MHVIYDVKSDVNGAEQHEKAMFMFRDDVDLLAVLHKLALEYVMSPDGLKKYSQTGLPFDDFLKCLPPEKLEPYNVTILWPDREAIRYRAKNFINHYEIMGHLEAKKRTEDLISETRNVSERYARRMERLKAEGHPLISAWDSARVSDRALSWA